MNYLRLLFIGLLALGSGIACVDSPASLAAAQDRGDPLALSFEELARQAELSGDAARAQGFTHAAIAVRTGVAPSRLDLRIGNATESYEAFVSQTRYPGMGELSYRTLTAWRRGGDGITRILSLTAPRDSAAVVHPLSMAGAGPLAGASGLYQESTTISLGLGSANRVAADTFWVAVSGFVKVKETLTGSACPQPADGTVFNGVSCQQARYLVKLDVDMQLLVRRPADLATSAPPRHFWTAAEQVIGGYRLNFSCANVDSRRGCG